MDYDFAKELAWSNRVETDDDWAAFWQRCGAWHSVKVNDLQLQRGGVDRIVYYGNSALLVDEKERRRADTDIALEIWSQYYGEGDGRNVKGWALDDKKLTTHIAIKRTGRRRVVVLPLCDLLPACEMDLERWIEKGYRVAWQSTRGAEYKSACIFVPLDDVFESMGRVRGTRKFFYRW